MFYLCFYFCQYITMATSTFGTLSEFKADIDDWNSYVERLQFFFIANGITDESKQKAILSSSCGADACKIFKGLTVPAKPGEESVSELAKLMRKHQNSKPNLISGRFKFNSRLKQPKESISEYMAKLHRLTEFCDYGEALEGYEIGYERTQHRLLSEGPSLTLQEGNFRYFVGSRICC